MQQIRSGVLFLLKKELCLLSAARNAHVNASRLILKEYGDPTKVVERENFELKADKLGPKEVLIKMLLAPINPADINTIQGVYAVKPKLPFTLGNEGVAVVQDIGKDVSGMTAGDWVLPSKNAWGTWRSHAIDTEESFIKIRNDLSAVMAATIAVNPATAYRMLHDYIRLEKDDYVIQNGANSAVGQSVIQICHHLGIRTINIVRNRETIADLKKELTDMGADIVVTDDEIRTLKNQVPPAKLALNCVGGKSVVELIKLMDNDAVMVTYGGMSRQPLMVPTAPLIFKNIKLVGFWMTRWNWLHQDEKGFLKRKEMVDKLCEMAREENLRTPAHQLISIADFEEALRTASNPAGKQNRKLIFQFE